MLIFQNINDFYQTIYFDFIIFCICFQDQSRKLKHTENVKRWGAKKEKQAKQCEANKGKYHMTSSAFLKYFSLQFTLFGLNFFLICLQDQSRKLKHAENIKRRARRKAVVALLSPADLGIFKLFAANLQNKIFLLFFFSYC